MYSADTHLGLGLLLLINLRLVRRIVNCFSPIVRFLHCVSFSSFDRRRFWASYHPGNGKYVKAQGLTVRRRAAVPS